MILSDPSTKSVAATLALFWDIACLRRGPEELPVSWMWLTVTVIAQAILGLAISGVLPPLPAKPGVADHSVALLFIDVAVAMIWGKAILQVAGRRERFLQMMTGVFGCQLVLQPFLLTAYWSAGYLDKESGWAMAAGLLAMVLSVWVLLAIARVLRAATDWPVFGCALLVIAQGLATYLVAFAIFPDMAELLKQGS
jgi:hypothetical protein